METEPTALCFPDQRLCSWLGCVVGGGVHCFHNVPLSPEVSSALGGVGKLLFKTVRLVRAEVL